ncbi:hypothetical protein [Pseudomonas koreensis]|uniref:hypothetical protein n=1 Tax=Pseudomonas koreensis TaxID=198620 RepID=UPI00320922EC
MTHDELRELEKARRKTLWALASLHLGDPNASEPLAILDHLGDLEQNSTVSTLELLDLNMVRDSVPVKRHPSGIDIVLELEIPEPWRERFLQASIGSTRLPEGAYACDWEKFLAEWELEMQHLQNHRDAQTASG